jgi:hypothetical protein
MLCARENVRAARARASVPTLSVAPAATLPSPRVRSARIAPRPTRSLPPNSKEPRPRRWHSSGVKNHGENVRSRRCPRGRVPRRMAPLEGALNPNHMVCLGTIPYSPERQRQASETMALVDAPEWGPEPPHLVPRPFQRVLGAASILAGYVIRVSLGAQLGVAFPSAPWASLVILPVVAATATAAATHRTSYLCSKTPLAPAPESERRESSPASATRFAASPAHARGQRGPYGRAGLPRLPGRPRRYLVGFLPGHRWEGDPNPANVTIDAPPRERDS